MAMKRTLRRIGLLVLLALAAGVLYVETREGHYTSFKAASLPRVAAAEGQAAPAEGAVVAVASGALRGTRAGSSLAFLGIPYAVPPVGELRWQPPQPAARWDGVRDATHPGSACMQPPGGLAPFLSPMAKAYGGTFNAQPWTRSEDCLFLNVWTPALSPPRPLPVMVWLHGGSNVLGSGSQPTYNGVALNRYGVVLVTVNYRLGVFGFFSHPELTAGSPHHASGNYGLLDQLAALAWVRDNIKAFGGDPANVTLAGESAGAIDAAFLMTSSLSAGLFQRVISQSGPAFVRGSTLAEADAFGQAVGKLAPGDPHLTDLGRLRALPWADVVKLVGQVEETSGESAPGVVADGWVLTQSPRKAFLAGALQKVDLLIGVNGREFSAFRLAASAPSTPSSSASPPTTTTTTTTTTTPARPAAAKDAKQPGMLAQLATAARPCFGGWTNAAMGRYLWKFLWDRAAGFDQVRGDIGMTCPILAVAALARDGGGRVFVYRFDRIVPGKGEGALGAFHALEVPYVFGDIHGSEWAWLPFTSDDDALAGVIQTYWTNFTRTGNPNGSGLPDWPAWDNGKKEFLNVTKDAQITTHRNPQPLFSRLTPGELRQAYKDE